MQGQATDVFVSYSRRDQPFVRRLHDALRERGRQAWVDWEDIPPTAKWMQEVLEAIERADAFIFVISPDSVRSDVCRREVDHAVVLNKRIIPIMRVETDPDQMPEEIAARNWLFFRDGDDVEAAMDSLAEALDLDLDRVRSHTRLLVRALEWEAQGRDRSLALRGRELEAGQEWLAEDTEREPRPLPIQLEYVLASGRVRGRAQRLRLSLVAVALVVSMVLTAFAVLQRNRAREQSLIASAREVAGAALLQLPGDPELAILLAMESLEIARTRDGEKALHRALDASAPHEIVARFDTRVQRVALSPDGELALIAGVDGVARVWDLAERKEVLALERSGGVVRAAAFSPDGRHIATAGPGETAWIWSADGRALHRLNGHSGPIFDVAYSPDGARLVTTSADRTARIWDAATGREVAILKGHADLVYAGAFDPTGTTVATAGADGTARLWDPSTGEQLRSLDDRRDASTPIEVNDVAFDPRGKRVVISEDDGTYVVDFETGERLAVISTEGALIYSASFAPNGVEVVTTDDRGTVRVWAVTDDARTGTLLRTLQGHSGVVYDAAFSRDGAFILSGGEDGTVRLWPRPELAIHRGGGLVLSGALSPDGSLALAAGALPERESGEYRGFAHVWDPSSGRTVVPLRGHTDWVRSARWSPDGRTIVTSGDDGTARVWAVDTGTLLRDPFEGHTHWVRAAEFDTAGRRVVTASRDGHVRIWDVATGQPEPPIAHERQSGVWDAAFSPDGRRLVTGAADGVARVWDADTRTLLRELEGHRDIVYSVGFSPDGDRIVSSGADGTARIWDAGTGLPLVTLSGHRGQVLDAGFSLDGSYVVTAGADGTARVWDSRDGELVQTFRGHWDWVNEASFDPMGRVVTASLDQTARIYSCDACRGLAGLLELARERVSRELTPQERAVYLHESDG